MHAITKSVLAAVSLAAAVACAPTADGEAADTTSDAVTSSQVSPVAKTYKATCGSRFNSAEIFVKIAGGKVTDLAASLSTQDGKLRSDRTTSRWEGKVTADVRAVSAAPDSSSAVIHLRDTAGGELLPHTKGRLALTASQVRPSEDSSVAEVASSCLTTSPIATIDIRSKVTPDGVVRGISFSGVAPGDKACFSMDALTAASDAAGGDGTEGWWDITCDEDDAHTAAEGLTELVDALAAIQAQ